MWRFCVCWDAEQVGAKFGLDGRVQEHNRIIIVVAQYTQQAGSSIWHAVNLVHELVTLTAPVVLRCKIASTIKSDWNHFGNHSDQTWPPLWGWRLAEQTKK